MTTEFSLSLKGLKRTQGAIKEFSFQAGFDEPLESGLIILPQGRDVSVEGTLESVGDGVLVTAIAYADLDAQCSRCLTQFSLPVEADIQELFVYPEHGREYEEEDVTPIHDDTVDLTEAVHDGIILELPVIPLCREDCLGLCPVCGVDLNADPDHSHGDVIDSRWLSLTEWGKMS